MTRDEIDGRLEAMLEMYGDTVSQHRAETAQFGDSWPGAQIEIREMAERIAAFARKHGVRNPLARN